MTTFREQLPLPVLDARPFGARSIPMLTDEGLYEVSGVRVAFTGREGGVSQGEYGALNLGMHVGDHAGDVRENRRLLAEALDVPLEGVIVPSQVHGTHLVMLESAEQLPRAQSVVAEGCDGIAVSCAQVAPLLCFADCVPVVVVAPTGTFAVLHAGWRGAVARIVSKGVRAMATLDGVPEDEAAVRGYATACNLYVGPHIGAHSFECGSDVRERFINEFGSPCAAPNGCINLSQAVISDFCSVGGLARRVCDCGIDTMAQSQDYFSYRASGGVCGRHGAIAFRKE